MATECEKPGLTAISGFNSETQQQSILDQRWRLMLTEMQQGVTLIMSTQKKRCNKNENSNDAT